MANKYVDEKVLTNSISKLASKVDKNFTKKKDAIKSIELVDAIPTGSTSTAPEKCLRLTYVDNNTVNSSGVTINHVVDISVAQLGGGVSFTKWESNKEYTIGNYVINNGKLYIASADHTSSSDFNTDVSNWELLIGGAGVAELTQDLTSNIANGGINSGTTYTKGTSIETIIRDLLIKYFPADLNFSISPSKTLYKIGDTISTLDLIANVTKKSNNIEYVKYFVNGTEVNSKTPLTDSGLENGGSFTYTYSTPFTTDTTFKIVVNDGKNDTTKTIKVEFVNPFYVGLASGSLTQILQKKGNYTYNNINCNNDSVVFKYPKSYGELKSILDGNGFENLGAFTQTEEALNSIDYYVYTSKKATLSNFKYQFIF